ncbi:MAG TPA: L,D-transpeptidase [Polyangiaceae bacterium]|nr:L,D-transpeptidase [Polyangiaceae bacterium]
MSPAAKGRTRSSLIGLALAVAAIALTTSCDRGGGPGLEKADDDVDIPIPDVPEPPADGPKIGALSDVTPILDRPSRRGTRLGYIHAGEKLVRAAEPISVRGCEGGWFPVRPRGFVCATGSATVEMRHPTLVAMALAPDPAAALPYTYARTTRDTTLFEPDPARAESVRVRGTLPDSSGLAVVGSWTALDPDGKELRLAMTTEGSFVPVADLRPCNASRFAGKALDGKAKLPVAFVVKRGVHLFGMHDGVAEKETPLDYHARLDLTGRFVTVDGVELWQTTDERFVRARDVTLVRERHEMPSLVDAKRRWLDVAVTTGVVVAYEGTKPVYVTLASVGRDRLGGTPTTDGNEAVTRRGELTVVSKQVTLKEHDPATFAENVALYDVPYALELSSGQFIVGAYWHDRFGIEHGPGNIELSPADAAWIFGFMGPPIPEGWHGVTTSASSDDPAIVEVRK